MKKTLFTLVCVLFTWLLTAQDALNTARQYSEQRQYTESSKLLESFIGEHSERKYDVARAWWLQSYNLLHLGKKEEARKANNKSLNMRLALRSGDVAENYLREAEITLATNDPAAALVAVQQGMQMLIEDPLVYAKLNLYAAKALNQIGEYKDANSYMQIALDVVAVELGKSDPAYGDFLYQAGLLQAKQERYSVAFESFSTAYFLLVDPLDRTRCLMQAKEAHAKMWLEKATSKK